jgi:hypothetical protein
MKREKIIYQLVNDLFQYLLKYATRDDFPEEVIEQMLEESTQLVQTYEAAPRGVGLLAWKLFTAANTYLNQLEQKKRSEA